MKKVTVFIALGLISTLGYSQETNDESNIRRKVLKKTYVGLGGGLGAYQDAKFSNVHYSGISGSLILGTSRESEKYTWSTNFVGRYSALKTNFHPGKGLNVNVNYSFDYAWKLNETYQIGGKWDLANVNFTNFSSLGNNSTGIIFNTTVSALGRYTRPINDNLNVNFELVIGLFSVAKEATSFAYSASQKVLEEGIFDFQNEATTSPLSLKYASFETLGTLNKVQTSLSLDVKQRWNFAYNWDLFNYRTVSGYPITFAAHTVAVRFNYINKVKTRIAKK